MCPADNELDPASETSTEHREAHVDPFEDWPTDSPVTPAGTIAGLGRLASAARRPGRAPGTRNGARWFVILILLLTLLPIVIAVIASL